MQENFYENYFKNEDWQTYRYDVGSFCTRKAVTSLITKTPTKNYNVLEIGTGINSLLADLQSCNCFGIDISETTIKKTQNIFNSLNFNASLFVGNAEQLPFENNFFDVIVSTHTFEHIEKDFLAFQECERILKQNGELIIFVPGNLNGKASNEEFEKWGHYRNYNLKELKRLESHTKNLQLTQVLYPHKIHNLIWNRFKNVVRWANYPIKKFILRDNKPYETRKTYQKFFLPCISKSLDFLDSFFIKKEKYLLKTPFNVLAKFKKI